MARIGKIARLPGDIRAQLNSRLQDGGEGRQIVHWLNSLPEVKEVVGQKFDGRAINEQNLSDWRQGGYEEWLAHQDMLAQAVELAAHRQELEAVAPGQSPADHLAAAISFRYGAILAAQGPELDEKSLTQLKALSRICQAVVKLRRSDHNAARLKIETERWERAREQMDADRADALKRRQREDLAAPVWGALKKGERLVQFGGGKAARIAVELLNEIETCADPAHFESKVLASLSVPELRRDLQQMVNNPPKQQTEVQAALQMLREMEVGLGLKTKIKAPSGQHQSKANRRSTKPAKRHPAPAHRAPRTVRPVQRVRAPHPAEPAQPDDQVRPAPAPTAPFEPAPLAPDSGLSAPAGFVASSLRLEIGAQRRLYNN